MFHLPILRVFAQGSPWVALFFLLTGFVNIMGPVKKARDGNSQQALMSLASSVFRRPFRLILPTTIAGFFAWLGCQLSFYALAKRSEAWWMHFTSPLPDETWMKAIKGLFWNSFKLWKTGDFWYDKNQWSLPYLLQGSMMVYLILLGTLRCTAQWRMTIFGMFWVFSWLWNDAMVGLNVYSGAFLAEMNIHLGTAHAFPASRSYAARLFTIFLMLAGLYLCGYPEDHNEWTKWSKDMNDLGQRIFPKGADQFRFWPSLGAQLVTLSIIISPALQHFLTHPALLWLGSISFPVYLIHGPIIRSVLAWLLFGLREPIARYDYNEDGTMAAEHEVLPMPSAWMYFVALPIFFAVLFALSHVWNLYVEPWCAHVTQMAEDIMFGRDRPIAPIEKPHMNGTGSPKQNGILPH